MKTDVAVIGTGLSALAAARTIQQSGRQVVLSLLSVCHR